MVGIVARTVRCSHRQAGQLDPRHALNRPALFEGGQKHQVAGLPKSRAGQSLNNGYSSGDGHLCGEARDEGHCHPERRVTVLRGP